MLSRIFNRPQPTKPTTPTPSPVLRFPNVPRATLELFNQRLKASLFFDASQQKLPTFDHDSSLPGLSEPERDMLMVLDAVTHDLKRRGCTNVKYSLASYTSYSGRTNDGRHVTFDVPPPTKPQITGADSNACFGIHVKTSRDPQHPAAWSAREILTLRQFAAQDQMTIFLAQVLVITPEDCTPQTMTGFWIDYRGVTELQ